MRFKPALSLILCLLSAIFFVSTVSAQTPNPPVVRAVMFWMDGCPHCEEVIESVLPPLREQYGAQFNLLMIEVKGVEDVDMLYRVAASYEISKEQTGVPFVIIGERVLIGSTQVSEQLPALIKGHLNQGGVDFSANPALADLLPAQPSSPDDGSPAQVNPILVDTAPAQIRDNGFTLAIIIMVGMGLALLYSAIAFVIGKTFSLPNWADWFIPILIVIGIGVAGYLSYVETQSVEAMCGPVGDCNTVQQSPYAKLFGILPVGVLGLLGYLGMLAAWLARKYLPKFEEPADIGFFGLAFFAVVFSLYLTYLEPFVIRAVCIWCLTSAVIVTLLLLLGLPPALRRFYITDEGEE